MVQYNSQALDGSLAALADATRRGVLEQLSEGDATISHLAERFEMSLTGMKKHVGVLERAGLVTTRKVGRVRRCSLGNEQLRDVTGWIEHYRKLWDARFDALDAVIASVKQQEDENGTKG